MAEHDIDELVTQLASKNAKQRQDARAALVAIGSAAVSQLSVALGSEQQHVRWEAAKSLSEIADPAAAKGLVAALGDIDGDVRWVVGEALIALGRDSVQPLLTGLTEPQQSQDMLDGAHHVLHDLAKQEELGLGSLISPVLEAFRGQQPQIAVRVTAEKALAASRG